LSLLRAPPAAGPVPRSLFPQHHSDRVDLEIALGEQMLEAGVLGLELAQTADLGDLQVGVALAPAMESPFVDAASGVDRADRGARQIGLAQHLDDPGFYES